MLKCSVTLHQHAEIPKPCVYLKPFISFEQIQRNHISRSAFDIQNNLVGRKYRNRRCDSLEHKVIADWISGFGCRSAILSYKLTTKRNTLVTDTVSMDHEATQMFVYKLHRLIETKLSGGK